MLSRIVCRQAMTKVTSDNKQLTGGKNTFGINRRDSHNLLGAALLENPWMLLTCMAHHWFKQQ